MSENTLKNKSFVFVLEVSKTEHGT